MRRTVLVLLLIAVVALLIVPISAHPGGTDSNGGHYDHSSGDYHYHHGYPAHDHPGGKCPYDFASGSSSSSGGSSSGGGCSETFGGGGFFAIVFLAAFILFPFVLPIFLGSNTRKNTNHKTTNPAPTNKSKYVPAQSATAAPAKSNQVCQTIKEFDYSWDDSWDDYVETDTEDSKTEDSIEDLYDFYDNLPNI